MFKAHGFRKVTILCFLWRSFVSFFHQAENQKQESLTRSLKSFHYRSFFRWDGRSLQVFPAEDPRTRSWCGNFEQLLSQKQLLTLEEATTHEWIKWLLIFFRKFVCFQFSFFFIASLKTFVDNKTGVFFTSIQLFSLFWNPDVFLEGGGTYAPPQDKHH